LIWKNNEQRTRKEANKAEEGLKNDVMEKYRKFAINDVIKNHD